MPWKYHLCIGIPELSFFVSAAYRVVSMRDAKAVLAALNIKRNEVAMPRRISFTSAYVGDWLAKLHIADALFRFLK